MGSSAGHMAIAMGDSPVVNGPSNGYMVKLRGPVPPTAEEYARALEVQSVEALSEAQLKTNGDTEGNLAAPATPGEASDTTSSAATATPTSAPIDIVWPKVSDREVYFSK